MGVFPLPDSSAFRRHVLLAALLAGGASIAPVAWTPAAHAQVGLGAERYEVTITPPKRPGSEAAAEAATPGLSSDNVLGGGDASPSAADPANANPAHAGPAATAPAAAAAAPAAAKATDAGAGESATRTSAPAAQPVVSSGPPRTLQVGAFRRSGSAVTLRDKLTASFAEVVIVEVQSGGEPLYRVNVGRLPRGPALEDLKKRLVAAGYPTVEVIAPPPSAAD